jgi:FAD/FMN-containing dehydrogenase
MDAHALEECTQRIAGEVVVPGHTDYDELRTTFNNRAGHPAVIVRAQSHDDIVTALRLAREQHLPVSVRSGGHGLSGRATNTNGLVLDLTHFNRVELLDPEHALVRIGAGARWGDAARALAADGLSLSSGDTNQVGVGGLTLGGGIGWMVRTYGLTIDSLHAAQLITADGRLLHVSADEHPDLFWAIRGGGGNFGVITSFDFRVQSHTTIVGGSVIYDMAEVETVPAAWASSMREAPEELNSTIVLFPGFGPQAAPQIMVLLCYAGDDEEVANQAIAPFLHLGAVKGQTVQKKPYYAMLEDAALPPGLQMISHNGFLKTLSTEALGVMAANYGKVGSPMIAIRGLGGAMARVSPQATAFAHRENEALVVMVAFVAANVSEEQAHAMRRAAWRPLEPYSRGAYLNFLSDAGVAEVYPSATYARLASIKAIYDPDNVFNQNQNIKPAADTQARSHPVSSQP